MGFVFACGYCETPLNGSPISDAESVFRCPSCGQSGTLATVKGTVAKYLKARARNKLEDMFRGIVFQSMSVTHSDAPITMDNYRFIAVETDV
jgi:hypothetical protein